MADYFYDQQIRRLILQMCRMLGGFEVHTGLGADGQIQIRQVPCRWGEPSRMVSQIQQQVSENTMLTTPFMSIHITNIVAPLDRIQDPSHVDTKLVDEREFDENTGHYTSKLGDRFTVKRYMPVPYTFTFQLDIWTSNQDQKMQILEQIMTLFNPSIDLQSSENPLDWTAITFVQRNEDITWTSRTFPTTDEQIDISNMSFTVPYWINPPAELTRRRAIETIITNMYATQELPDDDSDFSWGISDKLYQSIITPGNHIIEISGNEILLLGDNGSDVDSDGNIFNWLSLLTKYSDFNEEKENTLEVKRRFGDPDGVRGIISFSPNENILSWDIDVDSLPVDTLTPITAIVDPTQKHPDGGLPFAISGQRYLIVEDILLGLTVNDLIGDGINNTFELDFRQPLPLPSKKEIIVLLNGVEQIISTDYTILTLPLPSIVNTKIIFVSIPPPGAEIQVKMFPVWGNVDAKANSIIEFDGAAWIVSFDSTGIDSLTPQILTNEFTSKQLRWNIENKDWEFAIDGRYNPGTWKIIA